MKSFLLIYQKIINILLPIIITGCIFYSDFLEQRISKIRTEYLIDISTINNSYIKLTVDITTQNKESTQKTYNIIKEQIDRLNQKYGKEEREAKRKEAFKKWFDWIPYALIFLMIVLNVFVL